MNENEKCKWYEFVMINDKSLTAFTSCTSPGSLITEHGSSILSLKIENQPKFFTRKKWAINCLILSTRPTCTDIPRSTPYSSSCSSACTFQHQAARAKAQNLMKNTLAFVFCKRESNHEFQLRIRLGVASLLALAFQAWTSFTYFIQQTNTYCSPFQHSSQGLPKAMP